jgi:hypothetical protein
MLESGHIYSDCFAEEKTYPGLIEEGWNLFRFNKDEKWMVLSNKEKRKHLILRDKSWAYLSMSLYEEPSRHAELTPCVTELYHNKDVNFTHVHATGTCIIYSIDSGEDRILFPSQPSFHTSAIANILESSLHPGLEILILEYTGDWRAEMLLRSIRGGHLGRLYESLSPAGLSRIRRK